jgi:hypothetical protein
MNEWTRPLAGVLRGKGWDWLIPGVRLALLGAILILVLRLAVANHRSADRGADRVVGQLALIAASLVVWVLAGMLVWFMLRVAFTPAPAIS